jgi:hypothetical protein
MTAPTDVGDAPQGERDADAGPADSNPSGGRRSSDADSEIARRALAALDLLWKQAQEKEDRDERFALLGKCPDVAHHAFHAFSALGGCSDEGPLLRRLYDSCWSDLSRIRVIAQSSSSQDVDRLQGALWSFFFEDFSPYVAHVVLFTKARLGFREAWPPIPMLPGVISMLVVNLTFSIMNVSIEGKDIKPALPTSKLPVSNPSVDRDEDTGMPPGGAASPRLVGLREGEDVGAPTGLPDPSLPPEAPRMPVEPVAQPHEDQKPKALKDENFEAFLEARMPPLSDGAKDAARMAFYGKAYRHLYEPVRTNSHPPIPRMLSPVHSTEDSSKGMRAFYEFIRSVGTGYPRPGDGVTDEEGRLACLKHACRDRMVSFCIRNTMSARQLQIILPVQILKKPGVNERLRKEMSASCLLAAKRIVAFLENKFDGYSIVDRPYIRGVWIDRDKNRHEDICWFLFWDVPTNYSNADLSILMAEIKEYIHFEYRINNVEQDTVYISLQGSRLTIFFPE